MPLRLDVQGIDFVEAALLFHALLDMADGGLPVGAGGNRGNGVLYLPHWPQDPQKALQSLGGELFLNGLQPRFRNIVRTGKT